MNSKDKIPVEAEQVVIIVRTCFLQCLNTFNFHEDMLTPLLSSLLSGGYVISKMRVLDLPQDN
jgi:hypothetical protein